jgi:hypothetical protein
MARGHDRRRHSSGTASGRTRMPGVRGAQPEAGHVPIVEPGADGGGRSIESFEGRRGRCRGLHRLRHASTSTVLLKLAWCCPATTRRTRGCPGTSRAGHPLSTLPRCRGSCSSPVARPTRTRPHLNMRWAPVGAVVLVPDRLQAPSPQGVGRRFCRSRAGRLPHRAKMNRLARSGSSRPSSKPSRGVAARREGGR